MKKIVNEVHVEGYLYGHEIEEKVSKTSNEPYITGKLSIATDNECKNIVDVYFPYVAPVFKKSGSVNKTYGTLQGIMNSKATVLDGGKDTALKLRLDSAIGRNEYYDAQLNLVSYERNEGGFVNSSSRLNDDEKKRSTFKADVLITQFSRVTFDEDKEKGIIKGVTFNFAGAALPIEFVCYNPAALDYFEDLAPTGSAPVFTQLWGNILSNEFVTKTETQNAFGETLIDEKKSVRKEYVVTGARSEVYDWDSEETILASEVLTKQQERELHLAELKQKREEYNSTSTTGTPTAAPQVAAGGFKF